MSAEDLRRRFNDADFVGRVAAGDLVEVVKRDSHPTLSGSTEPFCTRSQIVTYHTISGEKVAVAHRYLRRDGSVGGSGRPDPKMLRAGNVIFHVRPDAEQRDR